MDKLASTTKDIVAENISKLKQLLPLAFSENKIDFDTLKQLLGDYIENNNERYSFNWHGKNKACRIAQTPSTGTLRPCKDESVNWDNSKNLFIEGDNLEVLKLLQKSYHKKVKMIYIDPPYNTGKDFVYKDNFKDNIKNYKEMTGQTDGDGRNLSSNPETSGRYHTDWLNMMYPRLLLARSLLRDDGVIFISIDDNEVANLRKICDEIFGEENFIAQLIWDKNHSAQAGIFKVYHEYILVYAKAVDQVSVPNSSDNEEFEAGAMKKESKRHPMQKFKFPKGTRFSAKNGTELTGTWGGSEKVILHEGRMICKDGKLKENVILEAAFTQVNQMQEYFYRDRDSLVDSRGQKVSEFYFNSTGKLKIVKERGVFTPPTVGKWGTQSDASNKLAEIFKAPAAPLETPKSISMLEDFVQWFTESDSLIIDFFGGSCTTSHAVININHKKDENRNFIMVQLPEACDEKSEACKAGYKNIAEIGKECIRRAANKIQTENPDYQGDLGFKVFKLDSTNIKPWDLEFNINEQDLFDIIDNIKPERSTEDILYEILLKYGLDLTLEIKEHNILGTKLFNIGFGALIICLEKNISLELIEEIVKLKAEYQPETMRVVFQDSCFTDCVMKTNAVQILQQAGITDVKSL
jgi:adenine-specific DNA-methyltransferase